MLIELSKHHGLGNDFLVCDTNQLDQSISRSALAQRVCDRRRGVGADGLLFLTVLNDRQLVMVLHNADGSRAEMSGNGIRCLVQAAFDRSDATTGSCADPADFLVHTDAGDRHVHARWIDETTIQASVEMGEVTMLGEPDGWGSIGADPARPVLHLNAGNPHTVVGVEDVHVVDLLTLGQRLPQINLEIVEAGPEPSAITMRVHERGAGVTEACGTGACVSAWAAARWGLVAPLDGEILVHMDGGNAKVRLNAPEHGHVTLIGPAQFIARLQIEIP